MEFTQSTSPELIQILDELRQLEPLFHTGHDAEHIAAPTFWEVGASGRRYSRQYVLDVLRERAADPGHDGWHAEIFASPRVSLKRRASISASTCRAHASA
jgi:hypothetical protein